ncbi:NfeD family protein [Legionella spiritensis]|uniref:Inner membrane protein YbbJ n=1 Tax=Legionella spiritensis TaxID=452 RepID=A0A0W0Z8V4_LEGSP|nr:NfeD family protein [Legionella spiritensis]KTD65557.1 Inner membrane protein YbbJ [Legionella spiritensis]SNV44486.1 Inner membrane protein ybbJ [Legionella spiritensis]VEG90815.1 Inner membrane protein ybbJ [Legionella spiritensis]
MEWLAYWHWLALALLLVIAETLGAAGFLIALGMAAALTGAVTWLFSVGWQWQLIYFSIFCLFFAFAWWRFLKHRAATSPPSLINRPFESMVGRTVTLVEPIEDGRGKIRVNDAHWFVTGPELPAGTKVKITGIEEGTILVVKPLE